MPGIDYMIQVPEGHISTYSGRFVDPFDPDPETIDPVDIAHALANICRFTGHTRKFYSVAEHCVRCALKASDENAVYALLHDAPEAYISDIASPIKARKEFDFYKDVEDRLYFAILERFDLTKKMPNEVKVIDVRMRASEVRDLVTVQFDSEVAPYEEIIVPRDPEVAENDYIYSMRRLGLI